MLRVQEIAELDLGCELVVLSACRTVGNETIDGDWLNGLTRAFLLAGASGVLCTTWETGDTAAAYFLPTVYRDVVVSEPSEHGPIDVAAALRRVKLSRLRSPMFAHPSQWAPFVYHGQASAN